MNGYDFKAATYSVAKHEAGHWLCANSLGWEPRNIVVTVPSHKKDHYGYALNSYRTELNSLDDVRNYAMGRVKVLYSGVYAQHFDGCEFDHDKISRDLRRGGGANSDALKIDEIYFFYYNCLASPRGDAREFMPIICDVQLLIDMRYDFIDLVGRAFAGRASAPGEEIGMNREDLLAIYSASKIRLPNFT
ncbi:hypothetical protein H8I91_09255 [Serratia fonticola]|uniref:hypothetical protein n=1 Tax=Serratia fonticola TaxID=47917 RepID=UPI001645D897|nr:hypothetical protein [Serratia fonticola]MBC3250448.1 hypothetical protein [Serratia fonticola]